MFAPMMRDQALFIHSLNKFTESLLCVRHCSSIRDTAVKKSTRLCPHVGSKVGRMDIICLTT